VRWRRSFGLAPLGVAEWKILLLFPPTMFALEEGRKWLVRLNEKQSGTRRSTEAGSA
jgi:hypothetical protein